MRKQILEKEMGEKKAKSKSMRKSRARWISVRYNGIAYLLYRAKPWIIQNGGNKQQWIRKINLWSRTKFGKQ